MGRPDRHPAEKSDLFNAEFNNHPIPGANDLKDCNSILSQANALAQG